MVQELQDDHKLVVETGFGTQGYNERLVLGHTGALGEIQGKGVVCVVRCHYRYVSITANLFTSKNDTDSWKMWWKNPENVDLYQFMGKDNVPFHTVVFPATLIGTKDRWTKLHHLNTTEYLQYETANFQSLGVWVFLVTTPRILAFPLLYGDTIWPRSRPETSDSHFSWKEFVTKNNSELLANLGNLLTDWSSSSSPSTMASSPRSTPRTSPSTTVFENDVNDLLASYIENMGSCQHQTWFGVGNGNFFPR